MFIFKLIIWHPMRCVIFQDNQDIQRIFNEYEFSGVRCGKTCGWKLFHTQHIGRFSCLCVFLNVEQGWELRESFPILSTIIQFLTCVASQMELERNFVRRPSHTHCICKAYPQNEFSHVQYMMFIKRRFYHTHYTQKVSHQCECFDVLWGTSTQKLFQLHYT